MSKRRKPGANGFGVEDHLLNVGQCEVSVLTCFHIIDVFHDGATLVGETRAL